MPNATCNNSLSFIFITITQSGGEANANANASFETVLDLWEQQTCLENNLR